MKGEVCCPADRGPADRGATDRGPGLRPDHGPGVPEMAGVVAARGFRIEVPEGSTRLEMLHEDLADRVGRRARQRRHREGAGRREKGE